VEIKKHLKSKGKPRQITFGHRVKNTIQAQLLFSLVLADGFPNTPWQKLSERERSNILKTQFAIPQYLNYLETAHNPPISFSRDESEAMTLSGWKNQCRERLPCIVANDSIKFGFFLINMKYERDVLVEEFKKKLRILDGKPMIELSPAPQKTKKIKTSGTDKRLGLIKRTWCYAIAIFLSHIARSAEDYRTAERKTAWYALQAPI
jgi:hypothetical protein